MSSINFLNNLVKRQKKKQEITGMEAALEALSNGKDLTPQQAQRNLEANLVELRWSGGQHAGNGLMLTTGGHFLTCYHCVYDMRSGDPHSVYAHYQGRVLPIQNFLVKTKRSDLALFQLDVGGNSANHFKVYDSDCLNWEPVAAHVISQGILDKRHGLVRAKYYPTRHALLKEDGSNVVLNDRYELQLVAKRGDSGGIVANPSGVIFGLVEGGEDKLLLTTAVRISKAKEMIQYAINKMKDTK